MFLVAFSVAFTLNVLAEHHSEWDATSVLQRNASAVSLSSTSTEVQPVWVFYNMYIPTSEDIPRVAAIAQEQLSKLSWERHRLWITSIGAVTSFPDLKIQIDPKLVQELVFKHYAAGDEYLTFDAIWSHCKSQQYLDSKVVYLHPKGSYHPEFGRQAEFRQYSSAGALSEECLSMPSTCNVCSSRMSPLPTPHIAANMFAARCTYVAKLMDPHPEVFRQAMNEWGRATQSQYPVCNERHHPGCGGRNRYSNEHWILSHPAVQPCDLDANVEYLRGPPRDEVLSATLEFIKGGKFDLQPAPRFDFSAYADRERWMPCGTCGQNMSQRLTEYNFLYGSEPPQTWWGWMFFKSQAP